MASRVCTIKSAAGFIVILRDTRWHVPHFEKMLYDQAQLACSYLDAYQITHDKFYADIARDILAYVRPAALL